MPGQIPFVPIPKGLKHSAQGCDERSYPGWRKIKNSSTLKEVESIPHIAFVKAIS
jgi:hypothetical protein